jgi:hypothetical protein
MFDGPFCNRYGQIHSQSGRLGFQPAPSMLSQRERKDT